MRRTLTVAVLATLAVALLAALPSVAKSAVSLTSDEAAVIAAVNQVRLERGLPKLRARASLVRAARAHARDMAQHSYFSHTSRDGASVGDRVRSSGYRRSGYSVWSVGETLARVDDGGDALDAEAVVAGWMASPSHKRVILRRSFRDFGVGLSVTDERYLVALDVGRRIN